MHHCGHCVVWWRGIHVPALRIISIAGIEDPGRKILRQWLIWRAAIDATCSLGPTGALYFGAGQHRADGHIVGVQDQRQIQVDNIRSYNLLHWAAVVSLIRRSSYEALTTVSNIIPFWIWTCLYYSDCIGVVVALQSIQLFIMIHPSSYWGAYFVRRAEARDKSVGHLAGLAEMDHEQPDSQPHPLEGSSGDGDRPIGLPGEGIVAVSEYVV